MDIRFKYAGLWFEAEVYFDEDVEEFYTLTCGGQDASFLCESTLWPDIVASAWVGIEEAEFALREEAKLDRFIADREALR